MAVSGSLHTCRAGRYRRGTKSIRPSGTDDRTNLFRGRDGNRRTGSGFATRRVGQGGDGAWPCVTLPLGSSSSRVLIDYRDSPRKTSRNAKRRVSDHKDAPPVNREDEKFSGARVCRCVSSTRGRRTATLPLLRCECRRHECGRWRVPRRAPGRYLPVLVVWKGSNRRARAATENPGPSSIAASRALPTAPLVTLSLGLLAPARWSRLKHPFNPDCPKGRGKALP